VRAFLRPVKRIAHFYIPHATEFPPLPAPNVMPKAPRDFLPGRILLIKPGKASSKCFPSRRRDAGQALLRNPISEEGKSPLNPPVELLPPLM
jgi:hypothetical protein